MTSYLLRTKPMGERKAISGLDRIGTPAFTPTEKRVLRASRHAKRKREVSYPLAPRYVVAQVGNPHLLIHEIDEITGVVSTAGQTALRDRDVARLRAMEGVKTEIVLGKTLAVGQPIIVRDGPFRDHSSIIDGIDGKNATIRIDVLGKATPVEIPLDWLDPG